MTLLKRNSKPEDSTTIQEPDGQKSEFRMQKVVQIINFSGIGPIKAQDHKQTSIKSGEICAIPQLVSHVRRGFRGIKALWSAIPKHSQEFTSSVVDLMSWLATLQILPDLAYERVTLSRDCGSDRSAIKLPVKVPQVPKAIQQRQPIPAYIDFAPSTHYTHQRLQEAQTQCSKCHQIVYYLALDGVYNQLGNSSD